MQQPVSKRLRIIEVEHISIDLEYNEDFAIMHLPRLDKLNKSRLSQLKEYIENLHSFVETMGYGVLYAATDQPSTQKLAEKMGFEYLGEQNNLKVYAYAPVSTSNRSD